MTHFHHQTAKINDKNGYIYLLPTYNNNNRENTVFFLKDHFLIPTNV